MPITLALLIGAFIGWVGSLAVRTDTSERIIIDILVGALGALILALSLGNNSYMDSSIAAYLGAFVGLAVLYLLRRTLPTRSK